MGVFSKISPKKKEGSPSPKSENDDSKKPLMEVMEEENQEVEPTRENSSNDIILFSAPSFYVIETEQQVALDVIRMGQLQGYAKCSYHCADGSAIGGEKYTPVSGTVEFDTGKDMDTIRIPILGTDEWSATLDFKVILHDPVGCKLGEHLDHCLVKVVDMDKFPSTKLFPAVEGQIDTDDGLKEKIEAIPGIALCWEFFKLLARVEHGFHKVVLTLIFDQTRTMYVCLQLFLWMYVPDVLFGEEEEEEELFIKVFKEEGEEGEMEIDRKASQLKTSFIVALLYCVPMIALMLWDKVKLYMDVKGTARKYMQKNLFRRYLNYNEDSRSRVLPAHMQVAILKHADELAGGFTSMLDLCFIITKIAVILYFIDRENPKATKYEFVMVLIGFVWLLFRYVILSPPEDALEKQSEVSDIVDDTCEKYRLIANYYKRPLMNRQFAKKVNEWRFADVVEENYEMDTSYFFAWLGPCFIGLYIWQSALEVIEGELEMGVLLGTIVSFREINEGICEGHEIFGRVHKMVEPLREFTTLLNFQTDVFQSSQISRRRRAAMRRARKSVNRETGDPTDKMHLSMTDVQFHYQHKADFSLQDVRISIPQGSLVGVAGEHGTGKSTFMRLLAHEIYPTHGEVFIPTHLRHLLVSQEAYLVRGTLWGNLTYGMERNVHEKEKREALTKRVETILRKLGIWSTIERVLREQEGLHDDGMMGGDEQEVADQIGSRASCKSILKGWGCNCGHDEAHEHLTEHSDWQDTLSYSVKLKLHLARAFLSSGEVLIMQRPLHHFHHQESLQVLGICTEYVTNRGLCLPAVARDQRRPRTLFYSVENTEHIMKSDICIELCDGGSATQHNIKHVGKERLEALRAHFSKTMTTRSLFTDHCIEQEELAQVGVKEKPV